MTEQPQNIQKSFARRDRLLEIQKQIQELWAEKTVYDSELNMDKPKYFANFPYPYMNGMLHLGHAFSLSKAEFMIRYKRLKGFNTLFPFSYHCTGMPISAAAKKIKKNLEEYTPEQLQKLSQDKSGSGQTQYQIMKQMNIPDEIIPKFQDPLFWLDYFPVLAQQDIKTFGAAVDHRRSFITTSKNPYYNSFIEWQFEKLREKEVIKFGKRPSIFSPLDGQMCADHDRAEGEGVNPQEYTLIKIEVIDNKKEELFGTSKKVFLVAATLRPETMYGQTNCFVLPEGDYGVFDMPKDEIWICSDRSMLNMAYQDITNESKKTNLLKRVTGQQLIGLKCKAPLSLNEFVYVWPMLSISMSKGTGIVTSVPSDSPDDYAVMMELQKKKAFREKFGLQDEQVMNYKPIPIIEIPDYSDLCAVKICEEMKITSMNEKQKLAEAKDEVYTKGFYKGIMKVGEFAGQKVEEAKKLVKQHLIQSSQGVVYYEPEDKCVSRLGEECVVALCDQWYIAYGLEEHRNLLQEYISSNNFKYFNEQILKGFQDAIDWLKEWGCSRSFGLGTILPWDKQFLIESLSDSTIYMAYYTVSHMLQGDIQGSQPGSLDIKSEQLDNKVWDYIFLEKPYPQDCNIPEEKLIKMKQSFQYWYPFDLRVSGKDLIKNHLTMSLYNHCFIWGKKYLPKGFFCNGWIQVNHEKMSKSKGNFFTIRDYCQQYSTDAGRLGIAQAGDTVEDSNIELQEVENGILRLTQLELIVGELVEQVHTFRDQSSNETEFFDKVFLAELKRVVKNTDKAYEGLVIREVVKEAFFKMATIREDYRLSCGGQGMKKDLIQKYIRAQLLIMVPITPHICEYLWQKYHLQLKQEDDADLIIDCKFPEFEITNEDLIVLVQKDYLDQIGKNLRSAVEKFQKKSANKKIKNIYLVNTNAFQTWQVQALEILKECLSNGTQWQQVLKQTFKSDPNMMKKAMAFGSFKMQEYKEFGEDSLSTKIPFNEQEVLSAHVPLLCKDIFDTNLVKVINTTQSIDIQNVKNAYDQVLPMKPLVILDFEQQLLKYKFVIIMTHSSNSKLLNLPKLDEHYIHKDGLYEQHLPCSQKVENVILQDSQN